MKTKSFKVVALALVAIVAITSSAFCAGKKDPSALPDVIKIGTQQIPNGETIVKLNNLFDELGVRVTLVEFDSGRDVIAALASSSIDIGMLGTTPATTAISAGVPIQVIWIHDIIGKAESLVVKRNSGINGVRDLVGKKIATPFGSTAHYSLLNALRLEGVAARDVTVLDLQPADIYAAWQRGDIDGAYVWHPTLSRLQAEGGRVIITSEDLAGRGIITADIGVVRTDFGQRYPELVANYIRLQGRAVGIYKNDFPEAVRLIARAYDISEEESRQQITELIWLTPEEHLSQRYLGTSSQKGDIATTLKSTSEFLVEQGLIERSPDISVFRNAVNPSYIEAALR